MRACLAYLAAWLLLVSGPTAFGRELRFCADPDALPSSDRAQRGFDNQIAKLIAQDLGATPTYEWQRNGRGFVRDVLNKHRCDVVLGVPTDFRALLTTEPYYTSAYVFVTRRERGLHLASFDDPQLRKLKIGVQVLSEEYAPPGQALGKRGLGPNIVSYSALGAKACEIVDAVARKQIDAAIVWGPTAGFWARQYAGQLELAPTPERDGTLPLAFAMSLGVRKGDTELRDRLNAVLRRREPEVRRILKQYGVPVLSQAGTSPARSTNAPQKGGH